MLVTSGESMAPTGEGGQRAASIVSTVSAAVGVQACSSAEGPRSCDRDHYLRNRQRHPLSRRLDRSRQQGGRHRPPAGCGRRPKGRQRPPRNGDEPRAGRVPVVPEGHAAQPGRHPLARPRPLRPVLRTFLPDPLHPALPRRLRPGAGRPEGTSDLGLQDPRPPGVRPHRRRRDHHRPARPGPGQRGRDGDGGPPRARPAGPRRRARLVALRPPDLRAWHRTATWRRG